LSQAVPLKPPGDGERRDYAFSLDGELSVTFGKPVTFTAEAQGFLYTMEIANAKLVYKIPDQVSLTGSSGFDLGIVSYNGKLSAIVDPKNNRFGGQISSGLTLHLSALGLIPGIPSDVTIPTQAIAINNTGFGVYIPPGLVPFVGTVTYHWGDAFPALHPFSSDLSQFTAGLPAAAADRVRTRGEVRRG